MQGLVLLDPSFHPRASWELTAVLVLLSGHWPARGLLSGKWPLTPDSQGRSNGNGLAKESTNSAAAGEDGGLLGSSDGDAAGASGGDSSVHARVAGRQKSHQCALLWIIGPRSVSGQPGHGPMLIMSEQGTSEVSCIEKEGRCLLMWCTSIIGSCVFVVMPHESHMGMMQLSLLKGTSAYQPQL